MEFRAEMEEFRLKLEAMPWQELACRYAMRLSPPRLIQELVQVWRALRRRS